MDRPRPSYRHTVRLFVLVGVALAAALAARQALVPPSFGEQGHFRAAAVQEAREAELRHAGSGACADCHDDVAGLHAKDAHAPVPCETCHGPGAAHAAAGGEAPVRRPQGQDACLACHRLQPERPGDFPQITPAEHYRFVGVADPQTPCVACHDPHEPLFMDRDLRQARLHPLIHRCRDCHPGRTDEKLARPAGHPAIFQCDYCHGALATDFAARPHHEVRCTACHVFFRESDSAGRILRDADPRFCLLCHGAAEFRTAGGPPPVEWPEHGQAMGGDGGDGPPPSCLECHQDAIHRTGDGGLSATPPKERNDG